MIFYLLSTSVLFSIIQSILHDLNGSKIIYFDRKCSITELLGKTVFPYHGQGAESISDQIQICAQEFGYWYLFNHERSLVISSDRILSSSSLLFYFIFLAKNKCFLLLLARQESKPKMAHALYREGNRESGLHFVSPCAGMALNWYLP